MRSNPTTTTLISLLFIFLLFISFHPTNFYLLPNMPLSHSTQKANAALTKLHISLEPNGSLSRPVDFFPFIPPSLSSKDVTLNPNLHTRIRLYLPREILTGSSDPNPKLPILVFVHGGGFILCSVGTPVVHESCTNAASQLAALVISVDYRLAPESRLPAQYDDVLEALTWVKDRKDDWVAKYGDLSRCVLAGESAGGNIVFFSGLIASDRVEEFKPVIINGLVLIQPYFGGSEPTGSELRLVNDPVLPLSVNELNWELALPLRVNRSHEYCDPIANGGSGLLDRVRDLGWKVGVVASGGDPLFDRDMALVKLMEEKGISVKCMITKDDKHGAFISNVTDKRKDLLDFINTFL